MPNSLPRKPLSETKVGYALAVLGGTLGLPIGWIASPLVLFMLNKKLKSDKEKPPNKFMIWALIGIVGAPLCLIGFAQVIDDNDVKQPIAAIESASTPKSKGQQLINNRLAELDKMRKNPDFLLYGLSKGGPYAGWIDEVNAEANSLDLHIIESTTVGYLTGLARSYAIYKGKDNQKTLRMRKSIIEVINWNQVDRDDSSKWPESWR